MYETHEKWNISERVQILCCDIIASDTGRLDGASFNNENLLERDSLYFLYRHHSLEVVLKCCFKIVMGPRSGPDVLLFKRFREKWTTIDTTKYSVHQSIQKATEDIKVYMMDFFRRILDEKQPRAKLITKSY